MYLLSKAENAALTALMQGACEPSKRSYGPQRIVHSHTAARLQARGLATWSHAAQYQISAAGIAAYAFGAVSK